MYIIKKNFVCKHIADLTDSDWSKFKIHQSWSLYKNHEVVKDIMRDIETYCKTELRIDEYYFTCDSIVYDNHMKPSYIYNLKYIGDKFEDTKISDRLMIGVYDYEIESYFDYSKPIEYAFNFKLYPVGEDRNSNGYQFSYNKYMFETKRKYITDLYSLTDVEYIGILEYVNFIIGVLQFKYDHFKNKLSVIVDKYTGMLDEYKTDRKGYITKIYPNFTILFDEDGEIYKYYLDYP